MDTIGKRIRALREQRNWNQATLAKAVGIRPPSLSQIDTGRTKTLKAATILRIAAALEANPDYLLTGTGSPNMSDASNPSDKELSNVISSLPDSKRATALAILRALSAEID